MECAKNIFFCLFGDELASLSKIMIYCVKLLQCNNTMDLPPQMMLSPTHTPVALQVFCPDGDVNDLTYPFAQL